MFNPRTPVLVGVGQVLNRLETLEEAKEPLEMMMDALLMAEKDTGIDKLLAQAQSAVSYTHLTLPTKA